MGHAALRASLSRNPQRRAPSGGAVALGVALWVSGVGCAPPPAPSGPAVKQQAPVSPLGMFSATQDIGNVRHAGSTEFDPGEGYRVTGSGANIWGAGDEFQFAFRELFGNASLSARVTIDGEQGSEYRKAVVMIRESLGADSAFVDVAVHGGGLASLQYRARAGAETEQVRSTLTAPEHVRLTRTGNTYTGAFSLDGQSWETLGPVEVALPSKTKAGLGVCAHDVDALVTATFRDVVVTPSNS